MRTDGTSCDVRALPSDHRSAFKGAFTLAIYLRTAGGVGGEVQGGKEIVEKGSPRDSPRGPMTPRLDHCVAMLVTDTGDFISDTANSGSSVRECSKRVIARHEKR